MLNSKLITTFPFLISEADKLHLNDPNRPLLILAAQDLMLLDKTCTLDFIRSIQDVNLLFYAISSGCLARFPSLKFLNQCKKEIDRFKEDKEYPSLRFHYQKGVDYREAYRKNHLENRLWRAKQEKEKRSPSLS